MTKANSPKPSVRPYGLIFSPKIINDDPQALSSMVADLIPSLDWVASQPKKGRRQVARIPNLSREIYVALAKDSSASVRRYLASNSSIDDEVAAVLASDANPYVRYQIARACAERWSPTPFWEWTPNLWEGGARMWGEAIIDTLLHDEYADIRMAAIGPWLSENQATDVMLGDTEETVVWRVFESQLCRVEDVRQFLKSGKWLALALGCAHLAFSDIEPFLDRTQVERRFSIVDDATEVLDSAWMHPSIPPEVLRAEYERSPNRMEAGLLQNPSAAPDLLREIVHARPDAWYYIAMNPATPADALDEIARRDRYASTLMDVLKNPNVAISTLARFISEDAAETDEGRALMKRAIKSIAARIQLLEGAGLEQDAV